MLITSRVLLRPWEPRDREPFAAVNADPEVMAHYPATLDRERSDEVIERLTGHIERLGFGMWAAQRRADGEFLGFVGLQQVPFDAHFTPAVEIGWRMRRDAWGHGYATEAALACATHAFDVLAESQLLAMARPANAASRRVMDRLGMRHDPADDFVHGGRDFVLYRLAPEDLRVARQAFQPEPTSLRAPGSPA